MEAALTPAGATLSTPRVSALCNKTADYCRYRQWQEGGELVRVLPPFLIHKKVSYTWWPRNLQLKIPEMKPHQEQNCRSVL
jgi:hypothetical protein